MLKKNYLEAYKRHRPNCNAFNQGLPKDQIKFWFDCECPFYLDGHLPNGQPVQRQSTGKTKLAEVEEYRRALVRGASSNHHDAKGKLLAECARDHLALWQTDVKSRTLTQHAEMLNYLQEFMESKKLFHASDLTLDLLQKFKTEGFKTYKADSSRGTVWNKLRCFIEQAFIRGWITEPLHAKMEAYRFRIKQAKPFADKELPIIFSAALNLKCGTTGYASSPKTFWCLLQLINECGFRAGDAALFNPKVLHPTHVPGLWLYQFQMQKSRKKEDPPWVDQFVPDWLKREIEQCNWLSQDLPFRWHDTAAVNNEYYHAQQVYERMQSIGKRNAIPDCRPHRLRDSYACRLLLSGKSIQDVATLLGHRNWKTTQKYYKTYVRAYTSRLADVVADVAQNPHSYTVD